MLVLALDTSTRAGSCALTRDGTVIGEHGTDAAMSHDAQLPAALMRTLERAGVALGDVEVYAVAIGPGSFTGLRVGIATMQGLAFAAGKPLVGVSAFDALARIAGRGLVATWIDASRGEVYAALYENGLEIEPPAVEHPDAIVRRLGSDPGDARGWGLTPITFIGEAAGVYASMILSAMGDHARIATPPAPLLAGTIAAIAAESARAGHTPPPHAIRPLYVRRPDAELARDARPVP